MVQIAKHVIRGHILFTLQNIKAEHMVLLKRTLLT